MGEFPLANPYIYIREQMGERKETYITLSPVWSY